MYVMSTAIKNKRTILVLIAAGLAIAVAALIKVIAAELPQIADLVYPVIKAMALG